MQNNSTAEKSITLGKGKVIPLPGSKTLTFEELREQWHAILEATITDVSNSFLYHPEEMREVEGSDVMWKIIIFKPTDKQKRRSKFVRESSSEVEKAVTFMFYTGDRATLRVGSVVLFSKDWISIFRMLEDYIDNKYSLPKPPKEKTEEY